mmetsp:Transcript_140554/g.437097  ORF Transcript_140554/g.437097 Transcript_140554/m.437097 type:complete len:590 (+) Transcript_140554:138-1907(+)
MAEHFGFSATVIAEPIEDFVTGPDCKKSMESGDWGCVAAKTKPFCKLKEDGTHARFVEDFKGFAPDVLVYNGLGIEQCLEAVVEALPDVPRLDVALQNSCIATNENKLATFYRDLPDPETPPVLTFIWSVGATEDLLDEYKKALADSKGKEEVFKLIQTKPPPEMMFEYFFEPETWLLPRFVACSPSLFPNPKDWKSSDNIKVNGCLKLSKEVQDEYTQKGSKYFSVGSEYEQCKEFIAKHGPPVYIGWGSMFVYTKEHMCLLAVRALKRAGEKAIILGGWAKICLDHLAGAEDEEELRAWCADNVLFVKAAPHELLFPQCKAAVHHGGIGTAQASIAAGCPTVVTPVFSDQFDNAKAVVNSGCGVSTTRLGLLEYPELGDAIKQICSNTTYSVAAKAMAESMAKEDGVGTLSSWLEKFCEEEVKTGKYKARQAEYLERLYQLREKNKKMTVPQLNAKFMAVLMTRYPAIKEWNISNMRFMTTASDLASKGKLWWVQGDTVLARGGEGLKTPEVGRFKRFAFVEELAKKGSRLHVRRLKGKGPDEGWVTTAVKGKDMVALVKDAKDVGRVSQMQFDELFQDMQPEKEDD